MPPAAAPVVELQDVHKAYREGESVRAVLSGVELALSPGEFVVLLGRSGSGKSTLLNVISGIDLPSRGEVRVAGQRVAHLSERERTLLRRRHVGFVFQAYNLLPTLTVRENVRLPLELLGRPAREADVRVEALLERVGLRERAESFPDRLSGGEQQRVAVARALSHAPALLLADEPTGNLDAHTGQRVLSLLESLTRQDGACALVVTHDPLLAARADRVLALEEGRLVARPMARSGAAG